MAHNLHTDKNGKTSFAAVGQKAWHGLGQYVDEAMTAQQAIHLGGLDYIVEKRKLFTLDSENNAKAIDPDTDEYFDDPQARIIVPNYSAIVRTDTSDVLGVVTDAYQVIQNNEAFEFFDSIIDRGEAIYQTAGALGKGERIFITAKLPEDILVHGEQIENYILLTSGHDGRSPITAGFTSIRVVCNNTLTAALRNLQNRIVVSHYSNAKHNLREAAKVMGMASKYTVELNDTFNRMAEVKITDNRLRSFIETVMNPKREAVTEEEFSKQFTRQVDSIMDFAHFHPTQQTETTKGTVFGAYNAVSGYFGYLKNYETVDAKMKDIYFKGGAKRIETAYDLAISLI